jgi:hypothetical protein
MDRIASAVKRLILGVKGAALATEQDFGLGRRYSGLVIFARKESSRLSTLSTNKLPKPFLLFGGLNSVPALSLC